MRGTRLAVMLVGLVSLSGCSRAEPVTVDSLVSDMAGYAGERVRIGGEVVRPDGRRIYVSIGNDYFTVEDDTGRIDVWYGPGLRCPPRVGSRVEVVGRVVKPQDTSFHIFSAISLSIDSEPPLAEDQVRRCSLSFREIEIYETQGEEALQAYWRRRGEPVRDVVP
jgi:hypothetical protein